MSEQEAQQPVLDSPSELGPKLREARQAQQLTIGQVASSMRLSDRVVERLEDERGEFADAPVYIRGYLRNYARLLGEESLLPESPSSSPPPQSWQPERNEANRWQHIIDSVAHRSAYLVATFLVIGTLAAWIYQPGNNAGTGESLVTREPIGASAVEEDEATSRSEPARRAQAASMTPLPLTESLDASESAPLPVADQSDASSENIAASDRQDPLPEELGRESAASVVTAPVEDVAATEQVLLLQATQDSWVQVEQGEQRLVYDLIAAGEQRRVVVESQEPVRLLIGYAPGIQVTWQGNALDLAPHTRKDVARLSLTSGSEQ